MSADLRALRRAPVAVRAPHDVPRPPIRDRRTRRTDRQNALEEALDGVELAEHDLRMLRHWADVLDVADLGTLVSLLGRARAAGPVEDGGR